MARKTRNRRRTNTPAATTETESDGSEQTDERSDVVNDLTDASNQRTSECQDDRSIIDAVDSNTELLQQLLAQFDELRGIVDQDDAPADQLSEPVDQSVAEAECEQLRDRIYDLENQVDELQQQNGDLASQVANSNIRQTVSTASSGSDDALSWDERKKMILQQMEDDSFDAESFVESLQDKSPSDIESPAEYVENLSAELERCKSELTRRDEELHELRCLLDEQSETREGGVAIGAAAIAEMVDTDELVQQERERLQMLQTEWEEKFREGEIEASLERAKLSRERLELAKKQAALEEQLEHSRRETQQDKESGSSSSRRWLVKLGLNDKNG